MVRGGTFSAKRHFGSGPSRIFKVVMHPPIARVSRAARQIEKWSLIIVTCGKRGLHIRIGRKGVKARRRRSNLLPQRVWGRVENFPRNLATRRNVDKSRSKRVRFGLPLYSLSTWPEGLN